MWKLFIKLFLAGVALVLLGTGIGYELYDVFGFDAVVIKTVMIILGVILCVAVIILIIRIITNVPTDLDRVIDFFTKTIIILLGICFAISTFKLIVLQVPNGSETYRETTFPIFLMIMSYLTMLTAHMVTK